jgi:type IV pilus assembly protein PilM
MGLLDKRVVGIDFDSSQIRFVELKGSSRAPNIQNAGFIILPEETVKEGKISNEENMKLALKELWNKYKIKSKNVILGISNSDIIMRFIKIPRVPIDKLSNIIKFQASDYMPVNIEEFELDYEFIGEDSKEMNSEFNILLVAARKKMLYEFISVFKSVGLTVSDIKSSALIMDKLIPESFRNGISAIANISSEVCNILIVNEGIVKFARTVMLRESLSDAIRKMYINKYLNVSYDFNVESKTLNSNTDRVSNAKNEIKKQNEANQVNEVLKHNEVLKSDIITDESDDKSDSYKEGVNQIVDFITEEIRSSVGYFISQNRNLQINNVFLLGYDDAIEYLSNSLKDNIYANIEILKPYENLYKQHSLRKNYNYNPAEYAIAFSLALHGLEAD